MKHSFGLKKLLEGNVLIIHHLPEDDNEYIDKPYEASMPIDGKLQTVVGDTKEETLDNIIDILHGTLLDKCEEISKKKEKGLILKK